MTSAITIISLPCYNANGTRATSDLQCNPDGKTSACCPPGWQCVNNLYCRNGDIDAPGSCTDQDWNSNANPACPCPPQNDPENYMSNTILCSADTFLCTNGGNNSIHSAADCTNPAIEPDPVIDYGNGLGVPTATNAAALMLYYSGLAVSTASVPSRASITGSPSSSTTSTASATATTTAVASSGSGLSSSAKIGLGVGIGVGVPLIVLAAAIVFMLTRRRRSSQGGGGDAVSPTKALTELPVAVYRPSEPQQKSAELSTAYSEVAELSTPRPTHELSSGQARPVELDSR